MSDIVNRVTQILMEGLGARVYYAHQLILDEPSITLDGDLDVKDLAIEVVKRLGLEDGFAQCGDERWWSTDIQKMGGDGEWKWI